MGVGPARADMVLGDDLEDFWGTQFGDSTAVVKGVVIRLEPFDGAQGTCRLGRTYEDPKD